MTQSLTLTLTGSRTPNQNPELTPSHAMFSGDHAIVGRQPRPSIAVPQQSGAGKFR